MIAKTFIWKRTTNGRPYKNETKFMLSNPNLSVKKVNAVALEDRERSCRRIIISLPCVRGGGSRRLTEGL